MKYIDADRLKAEIEKRIEATMGISHIPCHRREELQGLLSFVDSLQQEQESVAERFARIVRGNLIGIDKEVQQEFEHLYYEITGNKMYGGYND